jgi:hypothetical protein
MTVRDELERVLAIGSSKPTIESIQEFTTLATVFFHNHGPALLEALKDAERYRFLKAHGILSGPDPDSWIDCNLGIDRTREEVE